jgi:hypothetical protein
MDTIITHYGISGNFYKIAYIKEIMCYLLESATGYRILIPVNTYNMGSKRKNMEAIRNPSQITVDNFVNIILTQNECFKINDLTNTYHIVDLYNWDKHKKRKIKYRIRYENPINNEKVKIYNVDLKNYINSKSNKGPGTDCIDITMNQIGKNSTMNTKTTEQERVKKMKKKFLTICVSEGLLAALNDVVKNDQQSQINGNGISNLASVAEEILRHHLEDYDDGRCWQRKKA